MPKRPLNEIFSGPVKRQPLEDIFGPKNDEEVSRTEAIIRGVEQGFGGLGDEGIAAIKNPMGALDVLGKKVGLSEGASPEAESYRSERDRLRGRAELAKEQHPYLYYGANIPTNVAAFAPLATAGLPGLVVGGALQGLGDSKSEELSHDLTNAGLGAGGAAVLGPVANKLGGLASKAKGVAGDVAEFISRKSRQAVEPLAKLATGATRTQAEKFAPGAAAEAVDRGLIKAFDAPGDIASRLEGQITSGMDKFGDIVQAVSSRPGADLQKTELIVPLRRALSEVADNPARLEEASALRKILQAVEEGPENIPLSKVESIKRDFMNKSNYGPGTSPQATKTAGSIYKNKVEERLTDLEPDLAKEAIGYKQDYSKFVPLQEAAEARALQLKQSPIGGLKDIASVAVGGAKGPIINRLVSPRIASTLAVGTSALSKGMQKVADGLKGSISEEALQRVNNLPQFSGILAQAAERGQEALATTHFMMLQTDPEYRRTVSGEGNE